MGKYAVTFLTVSLLQGADTPRQGADVPTHGALPNDNTVTVSPKQEVDVPGRGGRPNCGTVDEQLREAFPGGEVERASIRLVIRSKRLLVAADQISFDADGKVKLVGCGIIRFQAPKGSGKALQPTAIRCESARVTFDRPIHTDSDLGLGKFVSIELSGGVRLSLEE
jgi:hypothetical protein